MSIGLNVMTTDNIGDRQVVTMKKPRIELDSSSSSSLDSDREEEAITEEVEAPPPAWRHELAGSGGGIGNNRRWLLSKQLSMKETTREVKWERRRRQILRRSSLVSAVTMDEQQQQAPVRHGSSHEIRDDAKRPSLERVRSERARRLTDEDLDELRGSFELGFGFDEETGCANLRDTLPALEFYFAVNRQLSDPKLRPPPAGSPTSTLSAVSSSSTLPDTPSPRSPQTGVAASGEAWKIFAPGENPQLIKTRLRHWAQVVACSVKHGC